MKSRDVVWARRSRGIALAWASTALACTGEFGQDSIPSGVDETIAGAGSASLAGNRGSGAPGGSNGGSVGGTGAAVGGGAGAGGAPSRTCTPASPLPQRLVRLDFNKVARSLESLLGPDALVGVSLPGDTGNARQREFQALMAEGDFINTDVLTDTVNMTEGALQKLTQAELARLSGCGTPLTDACVQPFLNEFAEKAYRRPLTEEEAKSIQDLYAALKTAGNTVEEAARFAIEGMLIAPQSLYRAEFGQVQNETAVLTGFEVASQLSYFLTDAPPDAALYEAAKSGRLTTPEEVAAEVTRLLDAPATMMNLKQVVAAYYDLGDIFETKKAQTAFPDYNGAVANSMYTETERFIQETLWRGKLHELLTSSTSYVNALLANWYGVPYPGTPGDNDTFLPVQFSPGTRAGLLTQGSILTMRSRTDATSVVSRGLFINGRMLCLPTPPQPPSAVLAELEAQLLDKNATEREKSDYRTSADRCAGCHLTFDQYGLSLEHYDAVGRQRATYPGGVAIDASSTLPPGAGGTRVENAIDLQNTIADNGAFARCFGSNFLKYAQAQAQSTTRIDDCAVESVYQQYWNSDQSFESLLSAVARAVSFSPRAVGTP